MPTYDFICMKCKHRFERTSTVDHRNKVRCPKCSGKAQVVIAAVRSVWKGGKPSA
jgi:putative FmdB family regulatory protein